MRMKVDLKVDQEMRFCVKTREDGEDAKEKIKKMIEDEEYISLGMILKIWHPEPVEESYFVGWRSSTVKRKMRLRKIKDGWALYLPDETIEMPWKPKPIEAETKATFMGTTLSPDVCLRQCRVISKPKKNVIAEDFAFFHCWFQSAMPDRNGNMIMQALGIVEMQDGTVRQVRPDHIIFGWEEE